MISVPGEWRVVFAGTPEFAVPSLDALVSAGLRPVSVLTRPDRPAGRGRQLRSSAVKLCAEAHGLPVEQPDTLKSASAHERIASHRPDIGIVVAYGLLLPPEVLSIPARGWINVHASLLPRWRGAAPVQRALLAGDTETGVSIMQLEASLDSGPVWARRSTPIEAHDTTTTLQSRLAGIGAEALLEALDRIASGDAAPEPQEESGVTWAPRVDKAEARLDWSGDAGSLSRQVRAFVPWPVAQTKLGDTVLRIWMARPEDARGTPGTVLDAGPDGILVACGTGALRLLEVQWPGRRRVAAADLANSMDFTGVRLG